MMAYKDLLHIFCRVFSTNRVSILTGILSLFFLLSGCQTTLSPEQTTIKFWNAMAKDDFEAARKYTTLETQYLVTKQEDFIGTSPRTGVIVIDGQNAKVATVIATKNLESINSLTFDTVLLKDNDTWKIDYRQTLNNLSFLPFGGVLNSLRAIGDVINKKVEQQLPFLENQIRSFSDQLIRQLDEFRDRLEKVNPAEKR